MARAVALKSKVRRDAVVNLRMPTAVRDLIDDAAGAMGKTRTDFIIESSRQHATDVILDRRLFTLDAGLHRAFLRALDKPPQPTAALKRLFASKSPWEK